MTNWRVIRSDPREDAGDYSYEEIEIRQSPSTRLVQRRSVKSHDNTDAAQNY